MKIDGKKIALELLDNLKKLKKPEKFLGVFVVGENEKDFNFVKQKQKIANLLGIDFRIYQKEKTIKNDELRKAILQISLRKTCGGVIVQLPLPDHLNKYYVCNVIPKEKDIDFLGERALGWFYAQRSLVLPPPVEVLKEIIERFEINLQEKDVLILGRGVLIGRPISLYLLDKVKSLTVLSSLNKENEEILKNFDLIISGVGKANLFSEKFLKEKAVVIDFGYDYLNSKIVGDFNNEVKRKDILYTPTPNGTGPILVLKLFENFYKLNQE